MSSPTLTPPDPHDAGHARPDRRRAHHRHGLSQLRARAAARRGLRLSGVLRAARGGVRPVASSRGRLTRSAIAARAPGIWRYLELLPVEAAPAAVVAGRLDAAAGSRSARPGPRRRPALAQGRHPQPVAVVQGPRRRHRGGPRRRVRRRRHSPAPRPATSPARRRPRRRRVGLPAYVFIPADLERAKVDHALAYGATVVPIDGTYDDVNRLCLEIADETGWGFVNINLRPFYAEGSQDARLRDRRVARLARRPTSSSRRSRRARCSRASRAASRSWPSSASSSDGRSASSAARRPAARRSRRRSRPAPTSSSRSASRTRSSARWPSATRPTAATPSSWRAASGGSVEAIPDDGHRRGDPRRGPARGHLPGDGRRRDARRGRGGAAAGRHPRRRRGRRAADRQRPQDARRADARAGDGEARPAPGWRRSSGRACRRSRRGWRAAS